MPAVSNAATLVFPLLPNTILLGLDTLAVTPSPHFLGVTQVPAGWHFVYAGAHAALSIRSGFWFYVPSTTPSGGSESWIRIFRWNAENESLEPVEDAGQLREWRDRVKDASNTEVHRRLLPYDFDPSTTDATAPPRNAVDLEPLTGHIHVKLLNHLFGSEQGAADGLWMLSTASSAAEDRDDIPGLSMHERTFASSNTSTGAVLGEERELHFLGIDLRRTWRAEAVGRERTIDARDRSAALERVLAPWNSSSSSSFGAPLLGELQICFFAVLLLANWSALQEWKRGLELALTSRRLIDSTPEFFAELLRVLAAQLQRCDDVEGGLFDVQGEGAAFLKLLLSDFRDVVHAEKSANDQGRNELKDEMDSLESWVGAEWGWILDRKRLLRKGFVELEDGEQVEVDVDGFDAEDETGEYAPVVVDFGEGESHRDGETDSE